MRVFRIALAIILGVVITIYVRLFILEFTFGPDATWYSEYHGLFIVLFPALTIGISYYLLKYPYYLLKYLKLLKKESGKTVEPKKSNKAVENSQQTLSQKYSVLKLCKRLTYLWMIVITGWTLDLLVQINDASKVLKEYGAGGPMDNAMLKAIVAYVFGMFILFCLTKMIDFLFDLDKQDKILVSDKISSEEE